MLTFLNIREIRDEKRKKERTQERKKGCNKEKKNATMYARKKEKCNYAKKKETNGRTDTDGRTDTNRQIDSKTDRLANRQTRDKLTKPLKSSRFLEILLRTNYREQTSRLEIRDLNLIFPVPVPENGNGKIKKLNLYPSF